MIEQTISIKDLSTPSIKFPIIMGIINATPDSFFDGGKYMNEKWLRSLIDTFNQSNVPIIDIGAESSRPGSMPIDHKKEIERLSKILPTVRNQTNALISIDTTKPETALFALDNGVDIINDISGGESEKLLSTVANYNAGIILMHKKGVPKTMQDNPIYQQNITATIKTYLKQQILRAKAYGIKTIIVDPGIGFGKNLTHNLTLLNQLSELKSLNCPILIGASNKSFIKDLTGAPLNERLPGSIASILAAYQNGARIFRVHQVKETLQALTVFRAINE